MTTVSVLSSRKLLCIDLQVRLDGISFKDVVHIFNGLPLSQKKNEIMVFVPAWIQLEIFILSEVSQKDKEKYHMVCLICGI